jgi:hypothetical protein
MHAVIVAHSRAVFGPLTSCICYEIVHAIQCSSLPEATSELGLYLALDVGPCYPFIMALCPAYRAFSCLSYVYPLRQAYYYYHYYYCIMGSTK